MHWLMHWLMYNDDARWLVQLFEQNSTVKMSFAKVGTAIVAHAGSMITDGHSTHGTSRLRRSTGSFLQLRRRSMQLWRSQKQCTRKWQELLSRSFGNMFFNAWCLVQIGSWTQDSEMLQGQSACGMLNHCVPGGFRSHLWFPSGTLGWHWGVQDRHQDDVLQSQQYGSGLKVRLQLLLGQFAWVTPRSQDGSRVLCGPEIPTCWFIYCSLVELLSKPSTDLTGFLGAGMRQKSCDDYEVMLGPPPTVSASPKAKDMGFPPKNNGTSTTQDVLNFWTASITQWYDLKYKVWLMVRKCFWPLWEWLSQAALWSESHVDQSCMLYVNNFT